MNKREEDQIPAESHTRLYRLPENPVASSSG